MIRYFSLILLLSSFSFGVSAQEVNLKASQKPDITIEDYDARLKLAEEMHEIWPIRPKIEDALERVAQNIPQTERLRFKSAMRKAIEFQALEEASIDAMVEIFTAKELQAMINFYGSKEGRSVSVKTGDYEQALQPVLVKMLDKALLDTKLGAE
jgi:hypothetical protein